MTDETKDKKENTNAKSKETNSVPEKETATTNGTDKTTSSPATTPKETTVVSDGNKTQVKLENEAKKSPTQELPKTKESVADRITDPDKDLSDHSSIPAIDASDIQLQAPMATQEDTGTVSKQTTSPSLGSAGKEDGQTEGKRGTQASEAEVLTGKVEVRIINNI